MTVHLASIVVGGPVEPWAACGFAFDDDGRAPLANGAIELVDDAGRGLLALAIEGSSPVPADVDGVLLRPGAVLGAVDHPNGAFELDHVVVMTDSLERTTFAIDAVLGLECRRIRETEAGRQGFHRFDDQGGVRGCIIEVVESPTVVGASLWGMVVTVGDLDAAVELLGAERVGETKLAVQPGRRIATLRTGADLGVPLAFMTPTLGSPLGSDPNRDGLVG